MLKYEEVVVGSQGARSSTACMHLTDASFHALLRPPPSLEHHFDAACLPTSIQNKLTQALKVSSRRVLSERLGKERKE